MMTELRANPRIRALALLGGLVLVAGLMSLFNVSLVRAAGAAITVAHFTGALPATRPFDAAWEAAPVADVPLSSQQIWQPGGGSVAAVQVRALENGEEIAFLVSWADPTRDDMVAGGLPSDAAAIQLPIDLLHLPYQCMGQATSRVNIWQWKAQLEANARASEGAIPFNGTRNLTSNGICRAVDTEGINPVANSTWQDGRWHVIFSRALAPGDDGSAPLMAGLPTQAAFAVWDGGKGETRGMKAVSTWTPVTIASPGTNLAGSLLTMGILTVLGIVAVVLGYRFLPRRS
jgi:DMSO reductase family type II enzyme heme b subunit